MKSTRKLLLANATVVLALSMPWQMAAHAEDNGQDKSASVSSFGGPDKVDRTINVTARDIHFDPSSLHVRAGETVRFVVTNKGQLKHEFVIGADEGDAHDEVGAEGEGEARESNEIELNPGEAKELIWTFGPEGIVEFGCHVPGHYEAGMAGKIVVSGAT